MISSLKFIRKWVEDNYVVSPSLLYLDGINFQFLDRNKTTAHKVISLHPQLEGKQIILFVGRITDHKNVHTLFRPVEAENGRCNTTVGWGLQKLHGLLLEVIGAHKNKGIEKEVIFTGTVPWEDLPSYYSACSIYATCTLWEGFLRPKSFAFGKPVICFDVGPNSETVIDEKNGLLIKRTDPALLAEGMYRLLTNNPERQKMGEEGYRWARNKLDFDKITEQFSVLCEKNSFSG